VHVPQHDPDG